jgi:hypothetical protein
MLVADFETVIRIALCFAFYDSPLLKAIGSARGVEQLLTFCRARPEIIFVVDQLNALDEKTR